MTMPQRRSDSGRAGSGTTALWVGVVIVLWGAVLRLAAFDETLIEPDQSAILDAAFQTAHLRYFPAIGMKSSVGVMQTGIVPLLAAIPLFVVKRVIAVQWFLSALDVLALAWLYRAVRHTLGRWSAGVTGLLYATSPWVILYARTIWYQTLVATFATTAFAAVLVLLAQARRKPGILTLAMVSTTLMSMVHLAAAPWGVLLFVLYGVIAWRQRVWKAFWWGIGASAIIVLPYVLYLLRTSFGDVALMLKAGGEPTGLNTAAYRLSKELIAGAMIVANAHGDQWDRSVIAWDASTTLMLVLLGLSAVWAVGRTIKNPRSRPMLLFTVMWVLVVPSLFLFSSIHLQHFYLMMLFPAPYVLLGAWIGRCTANRASTVIARLWRFAGFVATALLVLIALWWSSLWIARIRLEAQGALQRPTRGWLMDRAAMVVAQYLQTEPDGQVIVLAQFEGEMSPFEWLRGYTQAAAVRVVPVNQGFLIPDKPVCYLLGPYVPADVLWPVASSVELRSDMEIPANPPWPFFCVAGPADHPAPLADWENGMSLLDTQITGELVPNGRLDIVHTWRYRDIKPGPYHFYNHLLVDGTFVAQVDGGSIPHWYWYDGDTLLTYFTLVLPAELPSGDYVLRTGVYTWPDLERVLRVTGEDGFETFVSQR